MNPATPQLLTSENGLKIVEYLESCSPEEAKNVRLITARYKAEVIGTLKAAREFHRLEIEVNADFIKEMQIEHLDNRLVQQFKRFLCRLNSSAAFASFAPSHQKYFDSWRPISDDDESYYVVQTDKTSIRCLSKYIGIACTIHLQTHIPEDKRLAYFASIYKTVVAFLHPPQCDFDAAD